MSSAPSTGILRPSPSQKRQLLTVIIGFTAVLVGVFTVWSHQVFSKAYLPHLYCYLDKRGLVWTHVTADGLIGASYFLISGTLVYLVLKGHREIPFHWMFLAFGLFIVACGMTHLVEVITVWLPIYVFSAGVKVFTACASIATAIVLPTKVPEILDLIRKAKASAEHRRQLEIALSERDRAQAALESNNAMLENQVKERTAQLAGANTTLKAEMVEKAAAQKFSRSLASIVESSDDAIIGKTLDGVIVSWNKGATKIYQYEADEIIGKSMSTLIPSERRSELREILDRIGRGEHVDHVETKRVRKDGTIIDMSVTVSPILDDAGNVAGASAIGRDITAQKKIETALRRSEEEYRVLFDRNPLPLWVFDRKTFRFLAVNEAAMRHYGYSNEEFDRMTVLDIRPTKDIPILLKQMAQPLPGLQETQRWEHLKKDGTVIQVEVTAHELDFHGRDAELVLCHDITERLRSEELLRQSQEKFSKAFKASPFGISITTEREGRYVDVNPAFLAMLGYERVELIGRTAQELAIWADPAQRGEILALLNSQNTVKQIEARFQTRQQETRLVQLAAERIQLDDEPCILAIMQDVTDSRRLEVQLRQSQKMEAIGRLAGGVAHDFNNMLGVIIGYSEIAQDNLSESSPVRKHLEQIKRAGERAAGLTRQLLAFSRQQVLEPRVLNLNNSINNLGKMLRRLIGENIDLIIKPAEGLGNVRADEGQVEQILMNLAVNARDAIRTGGRIVIETANVDLDGSYVQKHQTVTPGPYVMMSVSDNGIGMDEATMSQIFEPFFTTKGPNEGTGLGLSTVYGIVKQSGGHIWVYSEPQGGSTFKIYLPRVDKEPDTGATAKAEAPAPKGSETILVVEDDPALRSLLADFLEGSGYNILQAENGKVGLDVANGHQGTIDLVITDVIMPGMGGPELGKELRAKRPLVKLLYMSGYTGEYVSQEGGLTPDGPLLSKPFTKSSLLTKIRSVLDK